jgi:hypothetical protein
VGFYGDWVKIEVSSNTLTNYPLLIPTRQREGLENPHLDRGDAADHHLGGFLLSPRARFRCSVPLLSSALLSAAVGGFARERSFVSWGLCNRSLERGFLEPRVA